MKTIQSALSAAFLAVAFFGTSACEQQSPEVMVPKKDGAAKEKAASEAAPEAANSEPPTYIDN